MGAVKLLDKEITQYLGKLNVEQKEAVLSVVKTFAREEAWWNEKTYLADIDKRFTDMESRKIKGYTIDEMEAGARKAYKSKKDKK